jgi:hypothetical protein
MLSGKQYLNKNLKPLFESINPIKTESLIFKALGFDELNSTSSIQIQIGDRIEKFWNIVINDCGKSILSENKHIVVEGKRRQIDHLIRTKNKIYYLESKCNLQFDTEKKPASNDKVKKVAKAIEKKYGKKVVCGYFIPVVPDVSSDITKKYTDTDIYGVDWMLNTLKCEFFTSKQFFSFFKSELSQIIREKMEV